MTKDATCIQMRVEVRAWQILQGAAGPRGEIQPQSLLYHYSKIGWRWRHGKYDSMCELMGTAQGECHLDDLCARGVVCISETYSNSLCVCVWCEISSCSWMHPFFSCLHKRSGKKHVFVILGNGGESGMAKHHVILLNERLAVIEAPSFFYSHQPVSIFRISNPASPLSLHQFLVPVLETKQAQVPVLHL